MTSNRETQSGAAVPAGCNPPVNREGSSLAGLVISDVEGNCLEWSYGRAWREGRPIAAVAQW